jgi:hypothetical protein
MRETEEEVSRSMEVLARLNNPQAAPAATLLPGEQTLEQLSQQLSEGLSRWLAQVPADEDIAEQGRHLLEQLRAGMGNAAPV